MPIESTKPLKMCKFCNKEVQNLATHIINMHPSIIEKLEEGVPTSENAPISHNYTAPQQQNKPYNSINDMIREKLDTMLNIKIIEMLSANKDLSLPELKRALEPQQNTQLSDVIALHNAIYKDMPKATEVNIGGDGGGWLELANNAIPLIREMLPQRKSEETQKNDAKHTGTEEGNIGIRRLIPQEITEDRGESESIGGESSFTIPAKQQDSSDVTRINKGD
jgi:hypothetical protein